ncbi:MAG: malto-oligosyltrehalose trehalohydrolase [Syntrophorhabdaceae bacterium]
MNRIISDNNAGNKTDRVETQKNTYGYTRRFPIGAEVIGDAGVSFRLWAPDRKCVQVVSESPLEENAEILCFDLRRDEKTGYYSGIVPSMGHKSLYRFRLDNDDMLYPDPASRYQPYGPHGASQVIDPALFTWTDEDWPGVSGPGQVIYELHIGTFTPQGTWAAAAAELEELAAFGITIIEHMPVAEFPGKFGWGYDGVNLFAPYHVYGSPDDLRSFIDEAHRVGMGVILDVVYNHLGPDGNYLHAFSEYYLTGKYKNDWGKSINFDGPESGPVREFYLTNTRYWISEFHMDGLRFDATQAIFDASPRNIVGEIVESARSEAKPRKIYMVAENEPQDTKYITPPEAGGYGLDGIWNDDFHHSAIVAMTGRREAYYTDYLGSSQEFISLIKYGFLYQGQYYVWQKKCRGTASLDIDPSRYIVFIQNHDQIANSRRGERLLQITDQGVARAMTALTLLIPSTPMLFQGQEFGASSPFLYFVDLPKDLTEMVRKGRIEFLTQFPSLIDADSRAVMPDTGEDAFQQSKLDLGERESHGEIYTFHKDLLSLRKTDPVFKRPEKRAIDGAVLSPQAFVLRFFGEEGDDRLLIINIGPDIHLRPMPEPLLAPPQWGKWEVFWNSEDYSYGGRGTIPLDTLKDFSIPSKCALIFKPVQCERHCGAL